MRSLRLLLLFIESLTSIQTLCFNTCTKMLTKMNEKKYVYSLLTSQQASHHLEKLKFY